LACPAQMMYEVSYFTNMRETMIVDATTSEEAALKAYRHANNPYISVYGHGDYRVCRDLDGYVKVIRQPVA